LRARQLTTLKLQRCPPIRVDTLRDIFLAHSASLTHVDLSGCEWLSRVPIRDLEFPQALKGLKVRGCGLTAHQIQYLNHTFGAADVHVDADLAAEGWEEVREEYMSRDAGPSASSSSRPLAVGVPKLGIKLPHGIPRMWVGMFLDYRVNGQLPSVCGRKALEIGEYAAHLGLDPLAQHCSRRYVYGLTGEQVLERVRQLERYSPLVQMLLRLKFEALFHPHLPSLAGQCVKYDRKEITYLYSQDVSSQNIEWSAAPAAKKFKLHAKTADVRFLFDDGTTVLAHKDILRIRSPYFASMFSNRRVVKENNMSEISIEEVDAGDFKLVRQHLYRGTVPVVNEVDVELLLRKYLCAEYFGAYALARHLKMYLPHDLFDERGHLVIEPQT